MCVIIRCSITIKMNIQKILSNLINKVIAVFSKTSDSYFVIGLKYMLFIYTNRNLKYILCMSTQTFM